MPLTSSDYRGPLVVVAVGAGFLLVGAVPVAVTFSIGVRTSAKIIGMGFMGFGLLLMLPGLCWCVWVRVNAFRKRHWPSSSTGNNASGSGDDGMRSMVGENHDDGSSHGDKSGGGTRRSARTRSWPSSYLDPPLLIVADNEVCQASICTAPSTTSSAAVNNGDVASSADDVVFVDPVADQLQVTTSPDVAGGPLPPPSTDHPPPLRTQRSDPGPTDRTAGYDQSARLRTADDAPP